MKLLSKEEYIEGIRQSNKIVLSRTITLLESTRAEHRRLATQILEDLMPLSGSSVRIGVTGVPGAGKSTFIEAIGQELLKKDKKIAVLAIDPSSELSKGSILGDKTRMEQISSHPNVFIRPSPTSLALGGVGRRTRETILMCEAAGYDTIFVETVGVGQSETLVHAMVDCFLLLMIPGAGDELQGIKRGIMEMADIMVVNKADGERIALAKKAQRAYRNALHHLPLYSNKWTVPVLTGSAEEKIGLSEIWRAVEDFIRHQQDGEFFEKRRIDQELYWFEKSVKDILLNWFNDHSGLKSLKSELEVEVREGRLTSFSASDMLFDQFKKSLGQ